MSNISLADYLFRSAIGFDHYARRAESARADHYPPHNIVQTATGYDLTLAVAGFAQEDIAISVHDDILTVESDGRKAAEDGDTYLHQGISFRAFRRQFSLGEYVRVSGASLENGLLTIRMTKVLPESAKPKQIAIS